MLAGKTYNEEITRRNCYTSLYTGRNKSNNQRIKNTDIKVAYKTKNTIGNHICHKNKEVTIVLQRDLPTPIQNIQKQGGVQKDV
jgi:hypothetical protein